MSNHHAKFVFYYLLSFLSLAFIAISIGLILFGVIDIKVFDIITHYQNSYDQQFKFAISALIIASPVFYLVSRLIANGLRENKLEKSSALRKWLIYLILFISSVVILGVLIGVINSFLSGELSTKFILKALSVFTISGFIFSFYLYNLQKNDFNKFKAWDKVFLYLSIILIIVPFISVWFFIDSPHEARNKRLDNINLEHIDRLENAINIYYQDKQALPQSLDELATFSGSDVISQGLLNFNDDRKIEYHKLGDKEFELCSSFISNNMNDKNPNYRPYVHRHKVGWNCFSEKVLASPLDFKLR